MDFIIHNPDYKQDIETIFNSQGLMGHLGAALETIEPGKVTISMPFSAEITQQVGYIHAAAITSIVDTACGSAAATLMPPNSDVLTIEYKVNFLAPAAGDVAIAIGKVLKPGRTITVCEGDVYMRDAAGNEKLCAKMQATMIRRDRQDTA